jgi:hypothetical protein
MQTVILMVAYLSTTVVFQFVGFLISRLVDYNYPTLGLMTFLILFLASFGLAWPVAVRIADWLIVRLGMTLETEQSGGLLRRDSMESYRQERRDAASK